MSAHVQAVLFDKDGTLFDFHASWADWMGALIADLAGAEAGRAETLARQLGFDTRAHRFLPDSPVIAGTLAEITDIIAPILPDWSVDALLAQLDQTAAAASMVPVVELAPFLSGLREAGLCLGVATNASEAEARAQLGAVGVGSAFDFIAGFDSGFGAKPGPGMCVAFAEAIGVPPSRVVMVGDSLHDLTAGRAAGMRVAAVLTGLAGEDELAPHADVVLSDIGALPDWISQAG